MNVAESYACVYRGPGGLSPKSQPQVAFKWLFHTQYGYFMGTNDAYMGINGHICIQNVPPLLAGGFRGAKPPKLPFSAPYKHKRTESC